MLTLPITHLLHTRNGIVIRYADGSQDEEQPVASLTPLLSPLELEAVKYACEHPGWLVMDTYTRTKE